MYRFLKLPAIVAALVVTPQAGAAVLYSSAMLSGPSASPGAVGFTAAAPNAGPAAFSFNLDGYNSMDGVNFWEDDFTLALNGRTILALSYDLGGGGANAIFTNLYAAAVSYTSPPARGNKSLLVRYADLPLIAGSNVFTFAYASPTGSALGGSGAHAGPQGMGDEAWGVSKVVLTAPVVSVVPELASWAMMLTGLAAAGVALRARRRATTLKMV